MTACLARETNLRVLLLSFLILVGVGVRASAETVFHAAENNVPVAMIEVIRAPAYTQVRLLARTALKNVCWHAQGPDSPYLIADGRRYPFISGDNISICPQRRNYEANEGMVLRFRPLPAQARQLSLVEGQGGESQMIDPGSHRNERFWNFLRVPLD
jgi:hypothetical protein